MDEADSQVGLDYLTYTFAFQRQSSKLNNKEELYF